MTQRTHVIVVVFAGMLAILVLVLGLSATRRYFARSGKEADSAMPEDPTIAPTPESWKRVIVRHKELVKGMTPKQVIEILGRPNEISPLYEPEHFNPRQIGRTYVYRETKLVPPQQEIEATWLRVDFGKQDHVWTVRQNGLGGDSWVIGK